MLGSALEVRWYDVVRFAVLQGEARRPALCRGARAISHSCAAFKVLYSTRTHPTICDSVLCRGARVEIRGYQKQYGLPSAHCTAEVSEIYS